MKPASVAALGAFLAIAIGSFEPFYLRIYGIDSTTLRANWTELPYRKVPGLRRMLVEVDRRTPKGARVLLATPHRAGEGGYRYAYARAQFLLAGRQLVPLLEPFTEKRVPLQLQSVDYIACWHECATPNGFQIIWKSDDGVLLRRTK
ncbi:MAG TPA: hypothetical protein VKB93_29330 [Thermoanaerobaculia bacterium]|nr:hypothetical protein [Thermoanaerobaculia bacterium]